MFAVYLWRHKLCFVCIAAVPLLALAIDQRPVEAPRPDTWPTIPDTFTAVYGDFESFKQQVNRNPALVSQTSNYGTTPLHLAAESNKVQVIEFLVSKGADVNVRNDGGYTPLHEAAYVGALGAVKILVRLGADMSARAGDREPDEGRDGVTILAHAAIGGNSNVVRFLLKHGAPILYGQDKWSKPYYKYSALHWAVMGSTNWSQPAEAAARLRTIDLLADELGDINTMVTGFGLGIKPAFVVAADHGQYRIMEHLMENYPELDVNAGAIENKSALDLVTQQSSDEDSCDCGKLRLKVLRMLQKRGAQ